MNKNFKSLLALALCVVMCAGVLVSCVKPEETPITPVTPATFKQAEYNSFTGTMPSNWNELTYQDNNDTQILSYIGSSFFDFDYKFKDDVKYNADGSINKDGIVSGAYTINYSAATKLEDVTSTVDAKWGYTADQKGYAWKITLRDDLKWDDGTPITAEDFVYSMQAQLDPKFMNYRGNQYYDTLRIKNSRGYFFQDQEGTYELVTAKGYATIQAAVDAGETVYVDVYSVWGADASWTNEAGESCPKWLPINDTTVYSGLYEGNPDAVSGKDAWDVLMAYGYGPYLEPGMDYDSWISVFIENTVRDVKWEDVGIYAEGNAIVVCLDKAYSLLNEDGSLALWAGYYMSSLPLVHKAKYEAAKIAPADGATLWTSKYNSGAETTASWGPYKLVTFVEGSHYRLEKNEYWYGWNMEEYKNQYNISAINCEKMDDENTQWVKFIAGEYDDAALTDKNYDEYKDSKYLSWSGDTGTFGMQLYSNLSVLKASGNNNGILAIPEFRQAFSLAINRNELIETIWPGTATPCLGIVNSMYYYDIENAPNLEDGGVYRNTTEAKEALLRAYGFTQGEDGKWSSGDLTGLTLDEATYVLSGYNPTVAKQRLAEAIAKLTADPEHYGYDSTKDITMIYGASNSDPKHNKRCAYLQSIIDELVAGTVLEGKIKLVVDSSAGANWSDAFRNGETQIGFGYGFSGNAFNPFDIAGAYVDPDDNLNYHGYWDTSAENLTITLPAGNYEGAGKTITMSVQNWFFCLNGLATEKNQPVQYNWGEGFAPSNARLRILAALEEYAITQAYSVRLIGNYGGSFLGAKFAQFNTEYNTFMGFGGMRYMVVNYTDAEWTTFVGQNNGDLSAEYKKAE